MSWDLLRSYRAVWCVDFEYGSLPGHRPRPLCLVARELHSGRLERQWLADNPVSRPPYDTGAETLFISYFASAEQDCHLVLGWPLPARVLDLYAEFRCWTAGRTVPSGYGLLGALTYFGLDAMDAVEKEALRQLALRGGPYTDAEQQALLDYCQADVDALGRLLARMLPKIDLPRALLRGRYTSAVARMEHTGVPLDTELLARLRCHWDALKGRLIVEVDEHYHVFEPVGQRPINPHSILGAVLLQEAEDRQLDPHRLADAVNYVWAQERQATEEIHEARRAARELTGLTPQRIAKWENSGYDHATYPSLDVLARDLTLRFPALGLRYGDPDQGPDERDHAGLLWAMLRDRNEKHKPKYHPDILRQAAELLEANPVSGPDYLTPRKFSARRWAAYLERQGIPWPRLPSGALALDDDTFREMARTYPDQVGPIREVRLSLSQLRLREMPVGPDGRNRCLLSPFGSKTGRNQPSTSRFIFGPATWLRSLICPEPGRALAYVDWSQQELAIAAALSGDANMQEAYTSGDFYLTFARLAGAVPKDATKTSHAREREQFKTLALGVLYGLTAEGLARKLNVAPGRGRELLRLHRETFRTFWEWSDALEAEAMLTRRLKTRFGWTLHVGPGVNPRTLRNFPMQGNGAEMLRLACCLTTEAGIQVCAPVHDALLVEGPAESMEDVVAATQAHMRKASEFVLPGFPLRTEARIVRFPERYADPRGKRMWETVLRLLAEEEQLQAQAERKGWGWEPVSGLTSGGCQG